ncbi:MAG: response regulator, partial [Lachnospiraceae bacterium]|nr:response regulator [Lachnospiraceae bacterium]
DLILLDYEMPVTPGPQVLEMIRSEEKSKDIPVMFLTSKNDRESVEKVLSLNPVRYILKTVGRGEMLAALSGFFGD